MNYKGYKYEYEEDMMDEFKTAFLHYAVDSEGNRLELPYSQYRNMTSTAFKILVDLNFPDNPAGQAWNEDRLVKFKSSMEDRLSEL